MAKHFGSDTSAGALRKHMSRHVNPDIKTLQDYVKAGGDAKDLNIGGESTDKKGANGQANQHFSISFTLKTFPIAQVCLDSYGIIKSFLY